jgi:hypothetical protein
MGESIEVPFLTHSVDFGSFKFQRMTTAKHARCTQSEQRSNMKDAS